MTVSRIDTAKKFLARELERLNEQEREIVNRFISRKGMARNVEREFTERLSFGERVADRFAAVMGSWPFIIFQTIILTVWVMFNLAAYVNHWDPYPFILLNLALSFQAAYAAPILMMSQNRQADKDRLQSKHDYEVNLKAEMEIMQLHEKFNELRDHYWADLLRLQQQQIDMLERLVNQLCDRESARPLDHGAEGQRTDW